MMDEGIPWRIFLCSEHRRLFNSERAELGPQTP
jgi:hypothetical protein